MLRVTIELLPFGSENQKRTLGAIEIVNDGTGDVNTGHYDVTIFKWGEGRRVWRRGRVEAFPRRRLGPHDLLYRALAATVGGRN
jgi:hypothetical protein